MMLVLADGFVRHGYDVDLLVVRSEGELLKELPDRVRVVDLDAKRSTLAVPAIIRYLRKRKPGVFFATEHYSGLPAMYASLFSNATTRYFIRQDNTWSKDVARTQGYNRWLVPLAVGLLFRKATVIAVSQDVANDFVAHFKHLRRNTRVIYNPVIDPAILVRATEPPKHPWLLQDSIPTIVAVGRLAPAKGFDVLIDAFSRLLNSRRARLLILGEGPEREHLQGLISSLDLDDSCQLPGFQSNPYSYMAHASMFVLSSRFEGLPTVLIEALAVGTPVVATNCPSGPREILDGGRFGRMVPPEDSEALCAAMAETLDAPFAITPELAEWLQQFTVERSVSAHLRLIEK